MILHQSLKNPLGLKNPIFAFFPLKKSLQLAECAFGWRAFFSKYISYLQGI